MSDSIRKSAAIFLIVLLFLASPVTSQAYASEGTAGDYFHGIGTKFGRGLLNIVTSPAEIPCAISEDVSEKGGTGAFTGFGMGMVYMVRRLIIGVTEVATFIIPMERTIHKVCEEPTYF